MNGSEAFSRFLAEKPKRVLDIGAGDGEHTRAMRKAGIDAASVSHTPPADIVGDYVLQVQCLEKVEGLWACHVLEHQTDPGAFLRKMVSDCADNGLIAITVPWGRSDLVGGHVMNWSEGLLIYNMILAGLDCSKARVGIYAHQCSVLVRKVLRPQVPINMARGDIETLALFFPWPVHHGCTANLGPVNW